jgi:hypothetical protein
MGKTPLKDLAQLQLVLLQIPTKALYKLQVSVTQEVQSRSHTDIAELQQVKDKRTGQARDQRGEGTHEGTREESGHSL